eukprot:1049052-Prorocentrum_minimum.AAC.2
MLLHIGIEAYRNTYGREARQTTDPAGGGRLASGYTAACAFMMEFICFVCSCVRVCVRNTS